MARNPLTLNYLLARLWSDEEEVTLNTPSKKGSTMQKVNVSIEYCVQ